MAPGHGMDTKGAISGATGAEHVGEAGGSRAPQALRSDDITRRVPAPRSYARCQWDACALRLVLFDVT